MKANKDPKHFGLDEKYIITIARELAIALKYVHAAGIIHRDIKCANVLISQDGDVQLCDFGVSGALESNVAKRSTIIGTPFWMPPEMHEGDEIVPTGYGSEVDIWAYGCTVYELATGLPPNTNIAAGRLGMFLSKAPRLDGDQYSNELKEFVQYCLIVKPHDRPTAEDILKHPYIADSEGSCPTSSLRELVERYAVWERSGGVRHSLFDPNMGARPPSMLPTAHEDETDDDWNFSTTDDFDVELTEEDMEQFEADAVNETASAQLPANMSPHDRARLEQRARKGEKRMQRLFNLGIQPYEYSSAHENDDDYDSDLPFRNRLITDTQLRESVIDLDMAYDIDHLQSLDLADAPTIKAARSAHFQYYDNDDDEDLEEDEDLYQHYRRKRLTQEWTFPTTSEPPDMPRPRTQDWSFSMATAEVGDNRHEDTTYADDALFSAPISNVGPNSHIRPTLKHVKTEPFGEPNALHPNHGHFNGAADRTSMIDLDAGEIDDSRPSTSHSSAADSSYTEVSTGDPFDLEDNYTLRPRTLLHNHSVSEPSSDSVGHYEAGNEYEYRGDHHVISNHIRGGARGDDLEPGGLSRAPSVKASMDSLRMREDDDDEYSPETEKAPRVHSMIDLDHSNPSFMQRNGSHLEPASATETMKPIARFPHNRQLVDGVPILRHPRGRPGRDRLQQSVDSRDQAAKLLPPPIIELPKPIGPSEASLEEDAELDVIAMEMKRLLDDYSASLQSMSQLIRFRQQEDARV